MVVFFRPTKKISHPEYKGDVEGRYREHDDQERDLQDHNHVRDGKESILEGGHRVLVQVQEEIEAARGFSVTRP